MRVPPPFPRPAVTAALTGLVLTVLCFYPGYMSPDSIWQLAQARSGRFTDWHPPVMSWLWSFWDRAIPGPIGMLLLHALLFWGGLGLLAGQTLGPGWRAPAAILAIGLSPAVFGLLGTVWKDVGLGVSLILASSLLLLAARRRSPAALAAALGALLYATAVRHNGVVAVLPLALWAGPIAVELLAPGRAPAPGRRRRRVAGLAAGVLLLAVLMAISQAATFVLARDGRLYSVQVLWLHDLAGISLRTGRLLLPDFLVAGLDPPMTIGELQGFYRPHSADSLYVWTGTDRRRFTTTSDPALIGQLGRRWGEAIAAHPTAYLGHRLEVFALQLGMTGGPACQPFHTGIDANDLGVSLRPSTPNRWAMEYLTAFRDTPLFRGWIYAAVTLLVLALAGRRPGPTGPALALGASGLLYALHHLLAAPACDFRFSFWPVVAALALPLLAFSRRRDAARPRTGPPAPVPAARPRRWPA